MEKFVEGLKRLKTGAVAMAIIAIICGLSIAVSPMEVFELVQSFLGLIILIVGAIFVIVYLIGKNNVFPLISGVVLAGFGIFLLIDKAMVRSLIPIVVGIVLIIHGFQDFKMGLEAKKNGSENFSAMIIISIVNLMIGALCIFNPFSTMAITLRILGIAMIYDGVTDLWAISRVVKAARGAAKAASEVVHDMTAIEAEGVDMSAGEVVEDADFTEVDETNS